VGFLTGGQIHTIPIYVLRSEGVTVDHLQGVVDGASFVREMDVLG
jgi:hypothetical protein